MNEKTASLHSEHFTQKNANAIRKATINAFGEIDSSLQPIMLSKHSKYIDHWLKKMEPKDRTARLYLIEGMVIEAQLGRKELERQGDIIGPLDYIPSDLFFPPRPLRVQQALSVVGI